MPSVGAFACQQYKKNTQRGKKVHCKGVKYHHSLPFCFPFSCLFFISKENKCVICLLKLCFFLFVLEWYVLFPKHLRSVTLFWVLKSITELKIQVFMFQSEIFCLAGYRFGTAVCDLLNLSNWMHWNITEKLIQIWVAYIYVILPSLLSSVL